ncbi:MAG: four helix bundle protein [Candidatus Moranbacteria bacterium]|nr:four helix bundle protein [Candidatus Moranbacteria bacterium]
MLEKIISRLDILKFFPQLAWENKLIPDEKYIELSAKLQEIGRDIGAWKKGLSEKKTPTK